MRTLATFVTAVAVVAGSFMLAACNSEMVKVPQGAKILVKLDQDVNSEKDESGQSFKAELYEPVKEDGKVLAPAGTEVRGELIEVKPSGKVEGRAEMTFMLRDLVVEGRRYDLSTYPITIKAAGNEKRDAGIIGGAAAAGAAIGAIAEGGKGAAIGAGIGAGAGTGIVVATKGDEVKFDTGTRFAFTLDKPLELSPYQD